MGADRHKEPIPQPAYLPNLLPEARARNNGFQASAPCCDSKLNSHMYEVATMAVPTWCGDCGSFLTGFSEQGFMCNRCEHTVCPLCREKDWFNNSLQIC